MNNPTAIRPEFSPGDRLALTLCLAVIFHALIILGVTFSPREKIKPRYETMEVILVQQSGPAPDEAELLAQANQQGGGDVSRETVPATPTTPPPGGRTEIAATLESQSTGLAADAKFAERPDAAPAENPLRTEENQPSASALMADSLKRATLSETVNRKLETRAKRPKRTFISASTREYRYAAYMEAWRAKVERVGNMNYPEEARKRKITGQLILDVALNPDGGINQITLRRSSGHKILDDAAVRIVELAAPYAPFPDDIHNHTDILHITRTWQFLDNSGFR